MNAKNDIRGASIKDLITKYFYKQNHLCFQILIHLKNDETTLFGEYLDYNSYKKAFNSLQEARIKNLTISNPNKKINLIQQDAKVA